MEKKKLILLLEKFKNTIINYYELDLLASVIKLV